MDELRLKKVLLTAGIVPVLLSLCLMGATNPKIDAQKKKADTLYNLREYKKAQKIYYSIARIRGSQKTFSRNKYAPYSLYREALCLYQRKKYKKAIKTWHLVAENYKSSKWADDALRMAGKTYAGPLNKVGAGIKEFREILKRYPKSDQADNAQYYIGILNHIRGKRSEARKAFQKLLNDYPKSPFVPYTKKLLEEHYGKKRKKN